MTTAEKVTMLASLLSNDPVVPTNEMLTVYLQIAEKEILAWRYSYGDAPAEVPAEFEMVQVYAVLAGLTTSGAEGEVAHSENGISRTFRHDSMIAYIHANVRPICKVV